MFKIDAQPALSLLTVTRIGDWTLDTVRSYETALRAEMTKLNQSGRPTSFIIDVRATGAQKPEVADALRAMVLRLGPLRADRIAIVAASGIIKLENAQYDEEDTQIFTSLVLAQDWVTSGRASTVHKIYDEPSDVESSGQSVHVVGPSKVDFKLTPAAAIELSKRLEDVAVELLIARQGRSSARH